MAPVSRWYSIRDLAPSSTHKLVRRANIYDPGHGSKPPETFNNKGYFALFALLGVAMALASIWFFFWAKNGGFVWRKGDWEDYKTTVLRRKGKDGKTLSGATRSTKLGQNSIAGTFDLERDEMVEVKDYGMHRDRKVRGHGAGKRGTSDEDVKAYRHEKPARVGGLNRQHDGSHFDYSNTNSEVFPASWENSSTQHLQPKPEEEPPKKKGLLQRTREKNQDKQAKKETAIRAKDTGKVRKNAAPAKRPFPINDRNYHKLPTKQRQHSFATGDDSTIADNSTITDMSEHYTDNDNGGTHTSYYPQYRPRSHIHPDDSASRQGSPQRRSHAHHSPRHSQPGTPSRSRQSSPRKQSQRPTRHTPGGFDAVDAFSEAGSSETGTKVYSHRIPELSKGGGRDVMGGFRRGGYGGRRDSLSDSEEDGDLGGSRV